MPLENYKIPKELEMSRVRNKIERVTFISKIYLLMMPHPATFYLERGKEKENFGPLDVGEQNLLHRVYDELMAQMTSESQPEFRIVQAP